MKRRISHERRKPSGRDGHGAGFDEVRGGKTGYGKYAVTPEVDRIEQSNIIPSFNEYARRGEDSAVFKGSSDNKPVINIDKLQGMAADDINGKPAVFSVAKIEEVAC